MKSQFIALLLFFTSTAFADQISFNNVSADLYESVNLPNGYEGLNWTRVAVFHSGPCDAVKFEYVFTGYCNYTEQTGSNYMGTWAGEEVDHRPGLITYSDGVFDLHSALLTSAWNNDVVATFEGYRDGLLVGSKSIPLTTGFGNCFAGMTHYECERTGSPSPVTVDFGWTGLDLLVISGTGGFSDGIGPLLFPGHDQSSFIIGNMDVDLHPFDEQPAVPEPTALWLFSTGFLALVSIKRLQRFCKAAD